MEDFGVCGDFSVIFFSCSCEMFGRLIQNMLNIYIGAKATSSPKLLQDPSSAHNGIKRVKIQWVN